MNVCYAWGREKGSVSAGIVPESVVTFFREVWFFGGRGVWHVEGDQVLEFSGIQHEVFLFLVGVMVLVGVLA
jgi:hypothetical protein